jgi:hypothetical protein
VTDQPTLETWAQKCERLARELRNLTPDPLTSTKRQREMYAHKRYELQQHIRIVPDE